MAPPLYRPERYQGSARRRPCFESWHWKQVTADLAEAWSFITDIARGEPRTPQRSRTLVAVQIPPTQKDGVEVLAKSWLPEDLLPDRYDAVHSESETGRSRRRNGVGNLRDPLFLDDNAKNPDVPARDAAR